jgi:uncharacterized protein (DUF1697 family)
MPTYVALLRAVNLASHNQVSMSRLREVAADAGLAKPRTLLQSGNLLFESAARSSAPLEKLLEATLLAELGVKTPVLVRSAKEWRAIVAQNPFPDEARADPGHLLVMPLKAVPARGAVAELERAIVGRERVKLNGQQLYLVYPDGIGRSKLTGALIDKKLGVSGSARNWNTTLKLLAQLAD